MLAELFDTSSWNHLQWLAVVIMAFVVVAVVVLLHRITQIFKMSRKARYSPNLRPLRRTRASRQSGNDAANENN